MTPKSVSAVWILPRAANFVSNCLLTFPLKCLKGILNSTYSKGLSVFLPIFPTSWTNTPIYPVCYSSQLSRCHLIPLTSHNQAMNNSANPKSKIYPDSNNFSPPPYCHPSTSHHYGSLGLLKQLSNWSLCFYTCLFTKKSILQAASRIIFSKHKPDHITLFQNLLCRYSIYIFTF